MNIVLREINEKEVEKYIEFLREAIYEDFPDFSVEIKDYFFKNYLVRDRIIRRIRDKDVTYWWAFLGDKMVGYLVAARPEGGMVFVIWFGVLKDFQKQGFGREIMDKFSEFMKEEGVHAIHLDSAPFNVGFYKKIGFKDIGLIEKGAWGVSQHLMTKAIQEPDIKKILE